MSAFPFLSPFDRKIPGGPDIMKAAGAWHREDDLLDKLATATAIGDLQHLGAVKSVPGIWAHAATFFDLWSSEPAGSHPLMKLRGEAISAWRGLLAIVALADSSKLLVRLHSVQNSDKRPFLREVLPRCPEKLLDIGDGASRETQIGRFGYILYADDEDQRYQVAGLLTPTTLVLPARSFPAPNHPRVGWSSPAGERAGYPLTDPLADGALRPKQRDALTTFVRHLSDDVDRLTNETARGYLKHPLYPLREALRAFLNDLANRAAQPTWSYRVEKRSSPCVGPAFKDRPLSLLSDSPHHSTSGSAADVTDFKLVLRGGPRAKALIYADSFHEKPLNDDGGEAVVWRDLTVSETTEALVRTDLSGPDGPLAKGWRLFTARDLFASKLIEIGGPSGGAAFQYPGHGLLQQYLLPLTPSALMILSPLEIRARLSMREEGKAVVVSLRVPAFAANGRQRDCLVERHYGRDAIVRQAAQPPQLALWPDFAADDWRDYLLYQSADGTSFKIAGAVTRASALKAVGILTDAPPDAEVSPLAEPGGHADFIDVTAAGTTEAVDLFRSAPEALVCRAGENEGLLLLNLRQAPPLDPEAKWRIAVDYGTTNTGIAYRPLSDGPQTARPLAFENRTVLPFSQDAQDLRNAHGYVEARYQFISPERIQPPFLSLLRNRATSGGESLVAGTNAIAFATGFDWLDELQQYASNYRFGVKWSLDARTSVESFVRQATLQAAAEARARGVPLKNIQWSFTLPAALGEAVAHRYQEIASEAVATLLPEERGPGPRIDFPLESAAALSYMIHLSKNNVGLTQVVLDVGGHSTDIAIHVVGGRRALFEGSVEIGGRNILIDDWIEKERWETTRDLLMSYETIDAEMSATLERAFEKEETQLILLEMVINREGIPSAEKASENASENVAALIRRLDQRADFTFYALCEYVMVLLKSLELAGTSIDSRVGLNFCGRGAKLLRRARQPFGIDNTAPKEVETLRMRFREFATASKEVWGTKAQIEEAAFSNLSDAKMEVSLGAAALSGAPDFRSAKALHPMPQGEIFQLVFGAESEERDRFLDPTDAIDKNLAGRGLEETRMLTPDGRGALPCFRDFLGRYQKSLSPSLWNGPQVVFPSESAPLNLVTGATNRLDASLEEARRAAQENLVPTGFLQPLFTCAVASVLKRWDKVLDKTP